MHAAIKQKLNEADARIEQVIYLAGALAAVDSGVDALREFFEEEDEADIERLFGPAPDYYDPDSRRYEKDESIHDWLVERGQLGFLVQFATPVMEVHPGGSRGYSWGYCRIWWGYGDTIEQAVECGLSWVAGVRAEEEAKEKGGAK